MFWSGIIPVQQTSDAPENRAFLASAASRLRRRGGDASGEPAQRQRLQPDATRPAQRREEQTFAAEQRALHSADHLDVVIDRRLKRDDATGVHADDFTRREFAFVNRAARVNERKAVALQALQNETFAAEQSGAEAFCERDAEAHTFGGAKERVFLRE